MNEIRLSINGSFNSNDIPVSKIPVSSDAIEIKITDNEPVDSYEKSKREDFNGYVSKGGSLSAATPLDIELSIPSPISLKVVIASVYDSMKYNKTSEVLKQDPFMLENLLKQITK